MRRVKLVSEPVEFGRQTFILPCPAIPYYCRAGLAQFCRQLTGHEGDHDWGHVSGQRCDHGQVEERQPKVEERQPKAEARPWWRFW